MRELSPWRIRRLAEVEDIQPEYTYASRPDEVRLTDYWNIVVKRRRIIIILFLVVFAVGAYFALSATRLYKASATIKIEPQNPQVTGVAALQPMEARSDYDYHKTQFALLKSRPLASRVIADLGLDSNKVFTQSRIISANPLDHIRSWLFRILGYFSYYLAPLFESEQSNEYEPNKSITTSGKGEIELNVDPRLIEKYLHFISVEHVAKTRLVKVEFATPDPGLSQALANAHVQSFIRMNLESRFSLTKEARDFLEKKIAELRPKREKSEVALNNFRREHGVVSVEKGENIVVDRLVDLNKQLTAARAQRIEAESLYRTVENKNYQDLAEVMRQGLVQQLKGNVASLEAERARLSTIFKPDHPRIQELAQQSAAARQALTNEIANVIRGIQSSYAAALAKERALEAEANKQQQDALKLKELAVDYTVLEEEVKANRSLYENVLKRLSETNVSNDIAMSNMQIAEGAEKPRKPSAPNIPLYLLASIVSGLFFGVGIAFVQEYVDSRVGTPDDVRRSVGLTTLGVIPHLKFLNERTYNGGQSDRVQLERTESSPPARAHAARNELIISHSPVSIVSESYRTIRTALLLSQAEKPPQVVLLTSPAPGEGKTATTLNLAIALAQDGYSVLVLDGDMRKGRCHARLGLRNNKGLSNVLTGGLSLTEGIQPTSISGLSLLSRGTIAPNPSELLGSPKMKEVLQELRQTFKFILIDSPPVIAVTDAAILSVMSDGVLLVFNGQTTSTPSAQKAVERLDMVRARLLGVILNGVNLDNPHYSYYRTYSSYYNYESRDRDESIDERNGNSETAVHKFDKLSKIAQFWSERERPHSQDTTKTPADSKPVRYREANGCNTAANVSSAGDADAADVLQSVSISSTNRDSTEIEDVNECKATDCDTASVRSTGDIPEPEVLQSASTEVVEAVSSAEDPAANTISQEFVNRLIEALTKAVGPIASLVVHEHVASLGESLNAFPKRRLEELVGLISQEISNEQMRSRFRERMSEEIHSG